MVSPNSLTAVESPIFIVGVPRSGTTLLRLILTTHSELCIPPESTFFVDLENQYGRLENLFEYIDQFLDDLYQNEKFLDWQVDRWKLHQELSAFKHLNYADAVTTVYRTYLKQIKPTAKLWGDKNPYYFYHIDRICKYFPFAKFIHIIRDIRAVYSSLKRVNQIPGSEWNVNSPASLVTQKWKDATKFFQNHPASQQIYHIYYEDLILDPENNIRNLCDWLNIEFESQMLEFYKENYARKLVPTRRLLLHKKTLEPVSTEGVNAWKNELTFQEKVEIELLNIHSMKVLNYAPSIHWFLVWFLGNSLNLQQKIWSKIRRK